MKQRLIGAIVLVALAVIFLPMLVKGPAPDSGVSDVPLKAPEQPSDGQFETRELPLVTPGDAPAGGAVGMGGQRAAEPAPVQDNPDAADLAQPAGTALPPATAAGNYAVNFGAYSSQADADAVIARLKQSQLPGFSESTTVNGRPAWRVRIGPYAERAQAESVRLEAVKVRNDVNAQVVTLDATPAAPAAQPAQRPVATTPQAPTRTEALPPEPARPAPAKPAVASKPAPAKAEPRAEAPAPAAPAAPAASGVGFAVQLGAFGNAADANALRDRVRAAGFSAFVEQVRTDKGMLNRVRVGPVANRAEAEQLKAQVAARVGIAGMVRPHP